MLRRSKNGGTAVSAVLGFHHLRQARRLSYDLNMRIAEHIAPSVRTCSAEL